MMICDCPIVIYRYVNNVRDLAAPYHYSYVDTIFIGSGMRTISISIQCRIDESNYYDVTDSLAIFLIL